MSEQPKWTPGEWLAVIDRDEVPVVKSPEGGIADIWTAPLPRRAHTADSRWAEAAANAHLIAAAPELYEVLADTLRMLEAAYRQLGMWTDDNKRIVAARAVLAKARGEKPEATP